MAQSSSATPAVRGPGATPATAATAGSADWSVREQPCLRCGAMLNVARFAAGAKVRCAACRAVNITGEMPVPADRQSAIRRTSQDDEPLDRIFASSAGGARDLSLVTSASDTVDVRTLEKFQPALAGLAPTTPATPGGAIGAIGAIGANGPADLLGGLAGSGGVSSRWSDQLEACQLGAYKIIRRIATGGMGTVYEADHIALHRTVAVKILHRDIAGAPDIQERLHREALTLARIRHPHIVEIFDIGNFEGRPFLVMEFIAGGDLKSLLAARAMEEREALRIGAEIAEAVDYAHQRGIIHRDLKPANILLDEAQSVHAADFGLAKVIGSSTQLTATGTTVGTPAYMAPEQARGQGDQLDARADVYAIGAILYEMFTGRPPFTGAHLMDVLYKVVHERPAHPQKFNPKLSADAATVCMKAMAQRPEDRYDSAWALMSDLEALLHGESIQARPPSPAMLLWRNIKKYAAIWAMAAVLVLGIGFETGRYVVSAYRNHLASTTLKEIRTAVNAPVEPPAGTDPTALPVRSTTDGGTPARVRIDRYRHAIDELDSLYRKTSYQPAQVYQQALERSLQQWLTVDRLRGMLAEAESQMKSAKFRDAEIKLELVEQTDPGPTTTEAFGEVQALIAEARLRKVQLAELRENAQLNLLTGKFADAQRRTAKKDFSGAEEDLRGLLVELAADQETSQTPAVLVKLDALQGEVSAALQGASKHREEQMAAKLQKDLATQLDPFKAIPGISDLMAHWVSVGNADDGGAVPGIDVRPAVDPDLATPPSALTVLQPPVAQPPLTGPKPPSVSDVLNAIVGPATTTPAPTPPAPPALPAPANKPDGLKPAPAPAP